MHIIDPTSTISHLSDLECSVRGSTLRIGKKSVVDSFVKIKFTGGMGNITIGDNVYINSGCVLYSGNGILIGNNVAIAANVTIAPVNHQWNDINQLISKQGFMASRGGVIIEEDVWIGAGSVILDGAILKKGSIIAAGSLVKGFVPEYTLCGGNPIKIIGNRTVQD